MFAAQSLQDLVIKYEKKSFEKAKQMHAPGTDVELEDINKGNVSSAKVETA